MPPCALVLCVAICSLSDDGARTMSFPERSCCDLTGCRWGHKKRCLGSSTSTSAEGYCIQHSAKLPKQVGMVAADQGGIRNANGYLLMMCAMLICDISSWLVQDRRYILDMRVNSRFPEILKRQVVSLPFVCTGWSHW